MVFIISKVICKSLINILDTSIPTKQILKQFRFISRYSTPSSMPSTTQHHFQHSEALNKDNFTVLVEGNIGCGKSSFLDYFNQSRDVEIFPEPVDKWVDLNGHNTLNLMYTDPTRWSLAFQSYVQLTMLQNHIAPHDKRVKMIERSIFSGRYCFIENLFQTGKLSVVERDILDEWIKYMMDINDIKVDLIVYLKADPEVCLNRLRERSRDEECNVSLDYMTALDVLHNDWLIRENGCPLRTKILVLDANKDFDGIVKEFEKYKPQILNLN